MLPNQDFSGANPALFSYRSVTNSARFRALFQLISSQHEIAPPPPNLTGEFHAGLQNLPVSVSVGVSMSVSSSVIVSVNESNGNSKHGPRRPARWAPPEIWGGGGTFMLGRNQVGQS